MRKHNRRERAQALPILAMLLVAFIGMLGLAIDVGRLFVARTELSRAVDAAALAGVSELPDVAAAQSVATSYVEENVSDATTSFPATDVDHQLRVKGSRSVDMLFMRIFGFGEVDIDVTAAAGFGVIPIDAVMTIDATSSMSDPPCNSAQNNSGCPIKEAKDAATLFADLLMDGSSNSDAHLAIVPFRGCYKPPRNFDSCVPTGWIHDLSGNNGLVDAKISDITADGGSGTNVCLGLYKTNELIFGVGAHTEASTLRYVVLLSDGDNNYDADAFGNGEPPVDCRPTTDPTRSDGASGCSSSQTRERQLDTKTYAVANAMKAAGVEIFVVGFGVCGTPNNNPCDPSIIGGTAHDNTADQNLLKCLASSGSGTNNHYFAVPSASQLPAIFSQIAGIIAVRLIE